MFNSVKIIAILLGLFLSLFSVNTLLAQTPHLYKVDSSEDKVTYRTFCKNYIVFSTEKARAAFNQSPFLLPKKPFKITGNVLYDLNYRSVIDTPFAATDFVQHYVQSNLNFLVAEKYPLQIILSSRRSNSEYFKNYYDVSLRFNNQVFNQSIKDKLKASLQSKYAEQLNLSQLAYQQWERKAFELRNQKNFLQNPKEIQKLIEAKEFLAQKKMPSLTKNPASGKKEIEHNLSTEVDKAQSSLEMIGLVAKSKFTNTELDSLAQKKDSLRKKYTTVKGSALEKIDSLQDKISSIPTNSASLRKKIEQNISKKRDKFQSSAEAQEVIANYESKKKAIDSLERKADSLRKNYIAKKTAITKKIDSLEQKINAATNLTDLKKLDRIAFDSLSKREKFLLGLKTMSIGRSPVNYSDLSAKNISITGVNIEYSGRYYWAVAVGGVDYRFRDFVSRDSRFPSQYLSLVRFGKGSTQFDHFILTAYKGRKNNFGFATPSSQQNIYGFTLQSSYQFSPSQVLTMEAAKSSTVSKDVVGGIRKTSLELGDPTTTAYSFKYSAAFPKTNTRLWGIYRYTGANFQSFSLISNSANQHSWNINLDQSFFKRMITLRASVRKNEWQNPYVGSSDYNSQAVFKSIFLSFRKQKLPTVTLSYMPASQLTNVGGSLYESFFQVFTATGSHFYRVGKLRSQTVVSISKYEHSSKDSGFVYAGSNNLTISQLFTGNNWTATTTVSKNLTDGYNLSVFDQGLQIYLNKGFSFGAGIKLNILNNLGRQTGYYTNCVIPLKYVGDISFSYESSFLPGVGKELLPSNIGRATYYKRF